MSCQHRIDQPCQKDTHQRQTITNGNFKRNHGGAQDACLSNVNAFPDPKIHTNANANTQRRNKSHTAHGTTNVTKHGQRYARHVTKRRRRAPPTNDKHSMEDSSFQIDFDIPPESFPMKRQSKLTMLLYEREVLGTSPIDFAQRALVDTEGHWKDCYHRRLPFSALETPYNVALLGLTHCGSFAVGVGGQLPKERFKDVYNAVSGELPVLSLRFFGMPSKAMNMKRNPSITKSEKHPIVSTPLLTIPVLYESDMNQESSLDIYRTPIKLQLTGEYGVLLSFAGTQHGITIFPKNTSFPGKCIAIWRLIYPSVTWAPLGFRWGVWYRKDGSIVITVPTIDGYNLYWLGTVELHHQARTSTHMSLMTDMDDLGDVFKVDTQTGVQVEAPSSMKRPFCKPTIAASLSIPSIIQSMLDFLDTVPHRFGTAVVSLQGSIMRFVVTVESGHIIDAYFDIEKGNLMGSRYVHSPKLRGIDTKSLFEAARQTCKSFIDEDPRISTCSEWTNRAVILAHPVRQFDAKEYPLSLVYG